MTLQFACPRCQTPLVPVIEAGKTAVESTTYQCPQDHTQYHCINNIWHFLPPERAAYFQSFIQSYEKVRRHEGWGGDVSAHYQQLPYVTKQDPFAFIWHIRAKGYEALIRQLVHPLVQQRQRPLRIVDIGAGNGWLSNRLTLAGHNVTAVDLLINQWDGLGAHTHYQTTYTNIQAEFDHLPLQPQQFDLLIFNGAFHYALNYTHTLQEAWRVLKPDGIILIMDSPIYQQASSGQTMVAERKTRFTQLFGQADQELPHENCLTTAQLQTLATEFKMQWQPIRPFYGWRWRIRPWWAKLRKRREPANFMLLIGKKE